MAGQTPPINSTLIFTVRWSRRVGGDGLTVVVGFERCWCREAGAGFDLAVEAAVVDVMKERALRFPWGPSGKLGVLHDVVHEVGRALMGGYVPIDLHRRRSVVMHLDEAGESLGWKRIANDPEVLVAEVLRHGESPEVAIEATYGWYWAVDALEAAGCEVRLVNVAAVRGFENRRVKNDVRDCELLGQLMRTNTLPEAWIAPREVRERRALVSANSPFFIHGRSPGQLVATVLATLTRDVLSFRERGGMMGTSEGGGGHGQRCQPSAAQASDFSFRRWERSRSFGSFPATLGRRPIRRGTTARSRSTVWLSMTIPIMSRMSVACSRSTSTVTTTVRSCQRM